MVLADFEQLLILVELFYNLCDFRCDSESFAAEVLVDGVDELPSNTIVVADGIL